VAPLLLVHRSEHERDVRREEIVHLVAQGRLAQELGPAHKVANRHVEVPANAPGERVGE
jgi:hypothetical protein